MLNKDIVNAIDVSGLDLIRIKDDKEKQQLKNALNLNSSENIN